jgi:hypothetical protein
MGQPLLVPLDHVVLLTEDLERVAGLFDQLGFTVTPRTEHSAAMGTANRCVMMQSTYIEILEVVHPTERNAGWRALLGEGSGLRGLALRTDDAGAVCEALRGAGFNVGEVLSFAREDDEGRTLRFRICRLPAAVTPGYRIIICEHETPDLLWRPIWTGHHNRVRDIASVDFGLPDPVTARVTLKSVAGTLRDLHGSSHLASIGFAAQGVAGRLHLIMDDLAGIGRLAKRIEDQSGGLVVDLRPDLDLVLTLTAGK